MKKNNSKKFNRNALVETYFSMLQFGFSGLLDVTSIAVRKIFSAEKGWKRWLNIVARFIILPFKGIYYNIKYKAHTDYQRLKGLPWLLVISRNNRDVLKKIKEKIPTAVYLAYEGTETKNGDIVPLLHFRIWLYCYRFPLIWWSFRKKYGKKAWDHIDYIFKGLGQYEASLHFIKKYQPAYIVFSNDHTIFPRAMLLAAKELGVPTIYIQHASVTPYFPPLDFDLNLLEGQATLDQYTLNGPVSGKTKFVGMPKFDPYIKYRNTSKKVRSIGVCSNMMDETKVVEAFLERLSKALPEMTITFRPHPADTTNFNIPADIKRSTKIEPVFEFLQKQDLVIAGNTSVHQAAVLLNVLSVYYEYTPFKEDIRDMYRYCKNELAYPALNFEHLLDLIEKESHQKNIEIYKKAVYYNAVVGTENEGKSGALAAQYIEEYIRDLSN